MIYRIVDCEGTLVKEPLAGNPELEFDTCIDPASTNAVMNCGIAEALDEKFSKPNDPLNPWPDHTLLQYDATCNELVPIACQPTINGQALIANVSAPTTTVYSTDGTTFYDADFTVTTEPTGTAGTPTVVGDFYKYLATWYKKDGADYYEVASFTDAGTLITDASLITELDGHTFLTYSSVVYTGADDVTYSWGNAGGAGGVAFIGTRAQYETAKLIPEGQTGYIPSGALVQITDEDAYVIGDEQ